MAEKTERERAAEVISDAFDQLELELGGLKEELGECYALLQHERQQIAALTQERETVIAEIQGWMDLCTKKSTEITRLELDRNKLRVERDAQSVKASQLREQLHIAEDIIDTQAAEAARLRACLEEACIRCRKEGPTRREPSSPMPPLAAIRRRRDRRGGEL